MDFELKEEMWQEIDNEFKKVSIISEWGGWGVYYKDLVSGCNMLMAKDKFLAKYERCK